MEQRIDKELEALLLRADAREIPVDCAEVVLSRLTRDDQEFDDICIEEGQPGDKRLHSALYRGQVLKHGDLWGNSVRREVARVKVLELLEINSTFGFERVKAEMKIKAGRQ